jgi:DNA-binding NarL/FixJ family response regulator
LLWDTGSEELIGAIRAVLQGLVVLHPAASEALLGDVASLPSAGQAAEPLTPREREVLHLLAQGLPSKTIASRLRLSEHTIKFHIGSIMTKLGAASRTEAVTLALRRGLIAL